MIGHAWTVACTKCIVDPSSNNATLAEVIEEITLNPNPGQQLPFPGVLPIQLNLVSVWYRLRAEQPAQATGRFSFVLGDQVIGTPNEFAINLSAHYRGRTITRMAGLSIVGPGVY